MKIKRFPGIDGDSRIRCSSDAYWVDARSRWRGEMVVGTEAPTAEQAIEYWNEFVQSVIQESKGGK